MDCHHLDFTLTAQASRRLVVVLRQLDKLPSEEKAPIFRARTKGAKVSRSMKEAWSKIERMKEADLR